MPVYTFGWIDGGAEFESRAAFSLWQNPSQQEKIHLAN